MSSGIREYVKAYDIRGRVPSEINEENVYYFAMAYSSIFKPKKVCVGKDIRIIVRD